MEEFKYNSNLNYEQNYNIWRSMNNDEKQAYGDELYSEPEAKRVFDSMYGNRLVDAVNKLKEKLSAKSD